MLLMKKINVLVLLLVVVLIGQGCLTTYSIGSVITGKHKKQSDEIPKHDGLGQSAVYGDLMLGYTVWDKDDNFTRNFY
ncbi:MAG: hypothetical protein KAS70_00300 [Planctomycetes bacterium]|nr:hypothetical protein [Planctomycetota bacterium]